MTSKITAMNKTRRAVLIQNSTLDLRVVVENGLDTYRKHSKKVKDTVDTSYHAKPG
jgi:hypothetical protein